MDKNMIFLNKIGRHFRKESLCNCYFSILYAKTHETWNSRFCFHWMSLQKKLWMKKTMF